ncbi:MAG TPA: histidine kinase [Egibacteraceae bacterium]|nr:histidine kinase [Egibacteraceae bacterium]
MTTAVTGAARGTSPRLRASLLAWLAWGLTAAVQAGALALIIWNRATIDGEFAFLYAVLGLAAVAYASVGALVAARHPRNPVGWAFCVMGLGFAGTALGEEYAVRGLLLSPGALPAAEAIGYTAQWMAVLAVGPMPLVFLLFPGGRALSPGWRRLAQLLTASLAIALVAQLIQWNPNSYGLADRFEELGVVVPNPLGIRAATPLVNIALPVAAFILIAGALASVVSLVLRFRRARGEERQQIRWLVYAGAVTFAIFLLLPAAALSDGSLASVFWFGMTLMLAIGIPLASGIAILKYRLYDLEIVVRRTIVAGALLAVLTAVYLIVVVGIGAAVGGADRPALTFAGAAIVALAFQPARSRARRLADRLVYGQRATPYEVLSQFAARGSGAYSTEAVLPEMARLVAAGTGAASATVWLRIGDELRPAAAHPPEDASPAPARVAGEEAPAIPGADIACPVRHDGALLGAVSIRMPASEPASPAHERLIRDVASQAGLMLRNVRLTEELRANLEELRASRQRIVTAQDARAKALERNLHDGAQQQLVALAMKIGIAETLLDRDPEKARALLADLKEEARDALDNLRDLARGIYPPLLAEQGLVAALQAQARKLPLSVTVTGDGVGRFPQEIEAGVYFCCLEALQNIVKYAGASQADIRLAVVDGSLRFTVADDGAGFDPATTPRGAGVENMTDRIAALGGVLTVRSAVGRGTKISGSLPVMS